MTEFKRPDVSNKKNRTAEMRLDRDDLGKIMGSATGAREYTNVCGGWAGTDDATSTAPSDLIGNPPIPEEDKAVAEIERDLNECLDKDDAQIAPW